ncbi:MAG TPA: hypothetical protein DEB56_07080 [Thiobacillus sp.]|nr:hypothetical protein [Thiobacillus sp.]
MELRIKVDLDEFRARMIGFERDIPFAISNAMMRTCAAAQAAVRSALKHDFTIRSEWVGKGIAIYPQNAMEARLFKNELRATGDATAFVGSADEFMVQQTEGVTDVLGRKHHGKTYAVPQVGTGLPRETIQTMTPKRKWPGALGKSSRVFFGRLRTGRAEGVWRRVIRPEGGGDALSRTRKKPHAGERTGLELLYSLFSQPVKVQPRWPLLRRVEEVFRQKWAINTEAAIVRAINTSRGY